MREGKDLPHAYQHLLVGSFIDEKMTIALAHRVEWVLMATSPPSDAPHHLAPQ